MDMAKTLFDYISNGEKNTVFGAPFTEELQNRSALLPDGAALRFDRELAVKCDDDLFLAEKEGRLYLIRELPDESLTALDAELETAGAAVLPEALEGWVTDLCFASGYVLTAAFKGGALTLSESPEPVVSGMFGSGGLNAPETRKALPPLGTLAMEAVEIDRKRFLFRFPETGEIIFFNGRRFLFYAILRGRLVAGFVEIPPKE